MPDRDYYTKTDATSDSLRLKYVAHVAKTLALASEPASTAFYERGGMVFYDVHNPDRTIVLELNHERYARLVVEVRDPAAAVQVVGAAIA